jgi:hypothetical protein
MRLVVGRRCCNHLVGHLETGTENLRSLLRIGQRYSLGLVRRAEVRPVVVIAVACRWIVWFPYCSSMYDLDLSVGLSSESEVMGTYQLVLYVQSILLGEELQTVPAKDYEL